MSLEIKYQEVALSDVLDFFAKSFQLTDGSTVESHDAFVDVGKGKVIFKLYVRSVPRPPQETPNV